MLAEIQIHELEANYQFDSELPKIIQAVLSDKEEKKWSFGKEWAKVWRIFHQLFLTISTMHHSRNLGPTLLASLIRTFWKFPNLNQRNAT